MAMKPTPIQKAVARQPRLSGSTDQASAGTSSRPPRKEPSPATDIARPRIRENHRFSTVIMGSQVPAAVPSMMRE